MSSQHVPSMNPEQTSPPLAEAAEDECADGGGVGLGHDHFEGLHEQPLEVEADVLLLLEAPQEILNPSSTWRNSNLLYSPAAALLM